MNPLRYARGEWGPWAIGLLLVAVAILVVTAWTKRRERLGEWGPGLAGMGATAGFSPADLRGTGTPGRVNNAEDRWLLGLAAPFVEQAGLLHDRWSLVPPFCGEDWRRRLLAVATAWGAVRARHWRRQIAVVEYELKTIGIPAASSAPARRAEARGEADLRPLLIAELAMLLRLGVAARHTSAARARKRLLTATTTVSLQTAYSDWLGYGDAITTTTSRDPARAANLRADLRTLYATDGPWHEIGWAR